LPGVEQPAVPQPQFVLRIGVVRMVPPGGSSWPNGHGRPGALRGGTGERVPSAFTGGGYPARVRTFVSSWWPPAGGSPDVR
jgi:hypothetical protein